MSDSRFDLPPASAPNFNERVREVLSTYLGRRGDRLDRGVTLRDLSEAGLIAVNSGFLVGGGGRPVGGVGGAVPPAYEPDLTPPPKPTGFTASAAISNIFIECAAQTYLQGHGHAKTVVYGVTRTTGPLPTFADAVPITEFGGTVFAHPTNPSTTWHLWIKWVTVDGVASASPAGGTNGLVVTTGQDVSLLLDALTGEITESELFTSLGNRINLIDGTGPGSVTARIAVESTTRATQTGELYAQWTVKLDTGGRVAGFGLASTGGTAVPTSAFTVRADRFYIANPAGAGTSVPDSIPFIVQTTPTTIGGVAVPIGVYMTDGFIMNGTITNAKIANLAVDDAKIATLSVSKLTAGSIAVGQYVQSTSYIANTQGWRINGDGTAEFAQAVIRGGVFATYGTIGGNNITSEGLTSPGYNGFNGWSIRSNGTAYFGDMSVRGQINTGGFTEYNWPPGTATGTHLSVGGLLIGNPSTGKYFQIEASGNVFAPQFSISGGAATFSGNLSAAGGSFSGNLSAAGGTFSGTLTAAAINAVNTINIGDDQVTVPSSATGGGSASVTVSCLFGKPVIIRGLASSSVGSGGSPDGFVTITATVNGATVATERAPVFFVENQGDSSPGSKAYFPQVVVEHQFVPTYTGSYTFGVSSPGRAITMTTLHAKR